MELTKEQKEIYRKKVVNHFKKEILDIQLEHTKLRNSLEDKDGIPIIRMFTPYEVMLSFSPITWYCLYIEENYEYVMKNW